MEVRQLKMWLLRVSRGGSLQLILVDGNSQTNAGSPISPGSGTTYTPGENFGHTPGTDQSGVQINSLLSFTPGK